MNHSGLFPRDYISKFDRIYLADFLKGLFFVCPCPGPALGTQTGTRPSVGRTLGLVIRRVRTFATANCMACVGGRRPMRWVHRRSQCTAVGEPPPPPKLHSLYGKTPPPHERCSHVNLCALPHIYEPQVLVIDEESVVLIRNYLLLRSCVLYVHYQSACSYSERAGGGGGWDRGSCWSRVSGLGILPCLTTRLNNLTVRLQGRADYR